MNDGYEQFWSDVITFIFNGAIARGFAYIFLFLGLYLLVNRQRVALGGFVMGLSILIAFGSTLFNIT